MCPPKNIPLGTDLAHVIDVTESLIIGNENVDQNVGPMGVNLSFLASKHQILVRLLSLKSRYVYPFVNVNEIEPWLTTKNHG